VPFKTADADLKRQPGDRLAIGASQPRGGAHADAFTESGDDFNLLGLRRANAVEGDEASGQPNEEWEKKSDDGAAN
jgi:hypothetical protein